MPGKESSREQSTIDSAKYLETKTLMELGNIHVWNFVFELYTAIGAFAHSHVRWLDSSQLLAIFERGLRERCAVEGNVEMGDGERCMTEFEAQVLADLSVLKNQMATLLGDGNSGRIAIIEGRVDQHEQSFQRAKGFAVATGAVFTLVQFFLQLLHRK